jgi:MipA family protein
MVVLKIMYPRRKYSVRSMLRQWASLQATKESTMSTNSSNFKLAAQRVISAVCSTAFVCVLGTHTGVANAQQGGPGGQDKTTWGLGVGVVSTQKPYKDADRETKLLPMIQFENRYVQVQGPTLEVKLPGHDLGQGQRLDFRLIAQMNLDGAGYEDNDAPILAGMSDREGGFWGGGKVKWRNPVADLQLEWLGDLSGNSKGQRLGLVVEKMFRVTENLMVSPRAGVAWVDDNYVDYYFGVRAREATAWRPAYEGESGVIPTVGVRALYRFDAHHAVMFDARVAHLAESIKDSPLVDASSENRVLMSYMYRF